MSELLARLDRESQIASTSLQRAEILAKKGPILPVSGDLKKLAT